MADDGVNMEKPNPGRGWWIYAWYALLSCTVMETTCDICHKLEDYCRCSPADKAAAYEKFREDMKQMYEQQTFEEDGYSNSPVDQDQNLQTRVNQKKEEEIDLHS